MVLIKGMKEYRWQGLNLKAVYSHGRNLVIDVLFAWKKRLGPVLHSHVGIV